MIIHPLLAKKMIKVQDMNSIGISIYCVSRAPLASLIALIFVWTTAAVAGPNDDLIEGARNGNSAKVRKLLARGANANAWHSWGKNALMIASQEGHLSVVKMLLAKGVDVNAKDRQLGRTALMDAVWRGHLKVVELLLDKGADVNASDKVGSTALVEVAFGDHKGRPEVMKLLIARGADVNAKSKVHGTALIGVAKNGHLELVKLLLAKGGDVNGKDVNRQDRADACFLERPF